jgi:ankyrin repeat protein
LGFMESPTPQEFPLHAAARNGDHELLTTLLASSRVSKRKSTANTLTKATLADLPNTRNTEGFTPLHVAAETGHVHCIKILVKCGAAINAKDMNGRRPIRILTVKMVCICAINSILSPTATYTI